MGTKEEVNRAKKQKQKRDKEQVAETPEAPPSNVGKREAATDEVDLTKKRLRAEAELAMAKRAELLVMAKQAEAAYTKKTSPPPPPPPPRLLLNLFHPKKPLS